MRRFFLDTSFADKTEILLPAEEAQHIAKVLRMKEGDLLEVVNGKGELLVGKITVCHPKNVLVTKEKVTFEKPENHRIHIAIAPTKNIDRLEWFLEKSTELGVHEITLVLCKNSERKNIKMERLEKIIVSALKQSKRLYLPQFNPLVSYNDFIKKHPNGLIAHCYEEVERNSSIYKEIKKDKLSFIEKNTPILIGPEGDFTLDEVKKALENGYKAVTLGKNRLRTETAGIYACSIVKQYFEENE